MNNIRNPHAAVIVWNYDDRIGLDDKPQAIDRVESTIISTVSLISINTSKSKSQPNGTFQMVLAPTKNWVSAITAGSWCVLLMSNEPITEKDIKKSADAKKVKMIGKIESVRADVSVGEDGSKQTRYLVSGVDWGYVFNNIIYIDNRIQDSNEPQTQGQNVAIAIRNMLFGKDGVPERFDTPSNIRSIVNVFGQGLKGLTETGKDINRLANAVYDFIIPEEMSNYFNFIGPDGKKATARKINQIMTLIHGRLRDYDKYDGFVESEGYLDPFSFQGSHTFWQVLLDNSNPTLNEMYCDLRWENNNSLRLALYNRIKPFSLKGKAGDDTVNELKSFFQNIRMTSIDTSHVMSINVGTNWRDKYNFVEIKPVFQEFAVFAGWYKQNAQQSDPIAFQREGFRPIIINTKQFPLRQNANAGLAAGEVDFNRLALWSKILKEWYFDTHKMLNGTLTIIGQSEYIAVGDNIKFSADLVNPTPNLNLETLNRKKNQSVLAQVESVSHSFGVRPDGARTYTTTIQFVRGIVVEDSGKLVGDGMLDKLASSVPSSKDRNTKEVFGTSDSQDPDPSKTRGT
jgi:hypothetical protein